MVGYFVMLLIGIVSGIGVMRYANWRADLEAAKYRKRIQRLDQENMDMRNQISNMIANDAYQKGYEKGRLDPYDEAERFARAISARQGNMKFKHAEAC